MIKERIIAGLLISGGVLLASRSAHAAEGAAPQGEHGLDPFVLLGVAVILIVGKLGGELFERINQPAVLGELIGGIVIGNLALIGIPATEPLKIEPTIAALAEIGVIILLFEVGLESDLGEMMDIRRRCGCRRLPA